MQIMRIDWRGRRKCLSILQMQDISHPTERLQNTTQISGSFEFYKERMDFVSVRSLFGCMKIGKTAQTNKNERMMYVEFLSVALTALISVAVLFILAKIIGNRAISQMNMFDYINSITIGSISAELATSDLENMFKPLVAMVIYAIAVILFALVSSKSLACRRVIEGRTIVLLKNGKIYNRNFKKAKIDINEFMMQCRLCGYFNLKDIETAIQESNGKISILPAANARPANPADLNIKVQKSEVYYNVILDGKVLHENLHNAGFDEAWLEKNIKKKSVSDMRDVFVAVCNTSGELQVYEKQARQDKKDVFDA